MNLGWKSWLFRWTFLELESVPIAFMCALQLALFLISSLISCYKTQSRAMEYAWNSDVRICVRGLQVSGRETAQAEECQQQFNEWWLGAWWPLAQSLVFLPYQQNITHKLQVSLCSRLFCTVSVKSLHQFKVFRLMHSNRVCSSSYLKHYAIKLNKAFMSWQELVLIYRLHASNGYRRWFRCRVTLTKRRYFQLIVVATHDRRSWPHSVWRMNYSFWKWHVNCSCTCDC